MDTYVLLLVFVLTTFGTFTQGDTLFKRLKNSGFQGLYLQSLQVLSIIGCSSECALRYNCNSAIYFHQNNTCFIFAEYEIEKIIIVYRGATLLIKGISPLPPDPWVVSRAEWGAGVGGNPGALERPVSYVVVHHLATKRDGVGAAQCGGNQATCHTQLQAIQQYDIGTRGWSDMGENFYIDGAGRVYEGRGWSMKSAYSTVISYDQGGTSGHGKHLAVAFFGDYRTAVPSRSAMEALRALCVHAIADGRLTRDYTVLGHKDDYPNLYYECPGAALMDLLDRWPDIGE